MRSQDPGTVWIKWRKNEWLCESWCPVIVQSRELDLENVRNFLWFMQLISVGMGVGCRIRGKMNNLSV